MHGFAVHRRHRGGAFLLVTFGDYPELDTPKSRRRQAGCASVLCLLLAVKLAWVYDEFINPVGILTQPTKAYSEFLTTNIFVFNPANAKESFIQGSDVSHVFVGNGNGGIYFKFPSASYRETVRNGAFWDGWKNSRDFFIRPTKSSNYSNHGWRSSVITELDFNFNRNERSVGVWLRYYGKFVRLQNDFGEHQWSFVHPLKPKLRNSGVRSPAGFAESPNQSDKTAKAQDNGGPSALCLGPSRTSGIPIGAKIFAVVMLGAFFACLSVRGIIWGLDHPDRKWRVIGWTMLGPCVFFGLSSFSWAWLGHPLAFWGIDACNGTYEQIYGYGPGELH